jgi:hypothetical protein
MFVLIWTIGCSSQIVTLEEHTTGMIGHHIDEIKNTMVRPNSYASRIGWTDKIYSLPNGNLVFVEPEPRSMIHWEVDQRGIIIGFEVKDLDE